MDSQHQENTPLTNRLTIEAAPFVCVHCTKIDWQSIINRLHDLYTDYGRGYVPVDLPPWTPAPGNSTTISSCPVCAIFISIGRNVDRFVVMSDRACIIGDMLQLDKVHKVPAADHTTVNAVKSEIGNVSRLIGISDVNTPGALYAPRIVEPHRIDFAMLRGWHQHCTLTHSEQCRPREFDPLPGFRVLHCHSRRVIEAPQRCDYVALSYVWGKTPIDESQFPRTIQDAIQVALELGFAFLWIDRYCVNQDDAQQKDTQINNMDRVYSGASLVIVAAAGEDPSYGLPGVSTRARRPQLSVDIGDYKLVEVFFNIRSNLKLSRWASRAWYVWSSYWLSESFTNQGFTFRTFQEGYLAKWKLIFTDRQVLYICSREICAESYHPPTPLDSTDDEMGLLDMFSQDVKGRHASLEACIEEYTRRDLSYDYDALNACLGVLNTWATPSSLLLHPVPSHLWGLPIEDSDLHLDWIHPEPGTRRAEFPSWSWVGWKGPVRFYFTLRMKKTGVIEIGDGTGTSGDLFSKALETKRPTPWIDLYRYFNDPEASPPDLRDAPRFLRITSLCVPFDMNCIVDFLTYEPLKKVWTAKILADGLGYYHVCQVYMDWFVPLGTDYSSWLAILIRTFYPYKNGTNFGSQSSSSWKHGGIFLLLKPTGTPGVYERVGLMVSKIDRYPTPQDWPHGTTSQRTVIVI